MFVTSGDAFFVDIRKNEIAVLTLSVHREIHNRS